MNYGGDALLHRYKPDAAAPCSSVAMSAD